MPNMSLKKNEMPSQEPNVRNKNFEFDKVVITKIPRDPRHNSKIDYDKLKKILS